MLIYFKG